MRPWISKQLLYRPTQWLRGEPVLAHLADLERSQWLPAEALRARQDERVRQLVAPCRPRVPHYREAFRAHGVDPEAVRGVDDLAALPVLDKEVGARAAPRLVAEGSRARLDWRKTSGSTGIPMPVVKSRDALRAHPRPSGTATRAGTGSTSATARAASSAIPSTGGASCARTSRTSSSTSTVSTRCT